MICPICKENMQEIYQELTEKFHSNPIFVCRNNGNCKGWFCKSCEEYHPYGTCCAVEMVHDMRRGTFDSEVREFTNILGQITNKKSENE